ncbi:hypothetical protein ACGFIF_29185 [Kribbella sp. NPDC049174]|uniref:hypothetical protein n=1 Tax=Kribbella sp. NPDC049174 TaxID=3364112 RepID=UPI003715E6ED
MAISTQSGFGNAFNSVEGVLEVSTHHYPGSYTILIPGQSTVAGSLVELDLPLPADARIESALFEVIAEPVDNAKLSTIADIRSSTPLTSDATSAATVDFGRLVTLGGLLGDEEFTSVLGVDDVYRWTGTEWRFLASAPEFAEAATERLLLQSTNGGDGTEDLADRLLEMAGVVLPAVPPSLEVLIDGRTVWFERQGSSPAEIDEPSEPGLAAGVRYVVDRTDAVREAFARAVAAATDPAAPVVIRVALRAAAPGALRLTPQINVLRVYSQDFPPQGLARSFDLAEEGVVEVEVTPPNAQAVHEVSLAVRGTFGPERIQPATGPEISDAARIVLAVGRSLLIGLPRTLVSRFGTVSGARLNLRAPDNTSGGQVTGQLLAATVDGRPGEPIEGGTLSPVQVSDVVARWYTLPFAAAVAVPLPPEPPAPPPQPSEERFVAAWLELQPGYGEVECSLTAGSPSDVLAPGGPLRRRLSGGATGGLTDIPAIGPLRAAVRVVGLPDRDHLIAATTLQVVDTPDFLDVDPGQTDLQARLIMRTPIPATPPVLLRATCAAAGSLTLDTVLVTYREQEVSL